MEAEARAAKRRSASVRQMEAEARAAKRQAKIEKEREDRRLQMLRPRQPSDSQRLWIRNWKGDKKMHNQGKGELLVMAIFKSVYDINTCMYAR